MIPGKMNEPTRILNAGTDSELHILDQGEKDINVQWSAWYPTEAEIRQMIDGKPILLGIVGTRHPYVLLTISDLNDNSG